MHTFRRRGDDYEVGVWVPESEPGFSARFHVVLVAKHLRSAIRMTNLLNGGTGVVDKTMERTGFDAGQIWEPVVNGQTKDDESTARRAAVVRRSRKAAGARAAV